MPRHFSKIMQSPYFQTDHYKDETKEGQIEKLIERKFDSIKKKIMFWRGSK